MTRSLAWILVGVLVGGTFCASSRAGEPIAIGSKAAAWNDLPGVDDKRHSLADLKGSKVVVVAFTCNSCPYSVAYEDRIIAFARQYEPKGVQLVAINVNNEEADRLPMMKERAKEKGFPFAYLHDPSQRIGRAFGATVTPHFFVLDSQRRVGYWGAFDNAKQIDRVTRHYVKDAVVALLAGKEPPVRTTRAAGCRILYE